MAKLFKLDVYEVVVSSAANIMGPSVAAPMAASMGQKKLVAPGILCGILGYVIVVKLFRIRVKLKTALLLSIAICLVIKVNIWLS